MEGLEELAVVGFAFHLTAEDLRGAQAGEHGADQSFRTPVSDIQSLLEDAARGVWRRLDRGLCGSECLGDHETRGELGVDDHRLHGVDVSSDIGSTLIQCFIRRNNRRGQREGPTLDDLRECATPWVIVAGLSESGVPQWRSLVPSSHAEASAEGDLQSWSLVPRRVSLHWTRRVQRLCQPRLTLDHCQRGNILGPLRPTLLSLLRVAPAECIGEGAFGYQLSAISYQSE